MFCFFGGGGGGGGVGVGVGRFLWLLFRVLAICRYFGESLSKLIFFFFFLGGGGGWWGVCVCVWGGGRIYENSRYFGGIVRIGVRTVC